MSLAPINLASTTPPAPVRPEARGPDRAPETADKPPVQAAPREGTGRIVDKSA